LLFQFCDLSIPSGPSSTIKEELAKLGYSSDQRKVQKFENPALFWRPAAGTYLLCVCVKTGNLSGGDPKNTTFLEKSGNFGCFFFTKKTPSDGESH
jgi:hypothetical protein